MAAAGGPGARRGPFALGAAARRSLDKALQGLEKLQRLVEQPGLGLRNSPPCLLQLLPQMRQHLLLIRGQPGASLSCLWEAGYFPVYINNLQRKVKQATKLFKGDPAGIFQEGSASRRMLTKLSLIFSHMLGELRALIPNGQDEGHQYQPSQPPAKAFWRGTWGARSLVSWSEFQAGLQRVHPVAPGPMAAALRATMDLTCSDHVSIFEFDIFTRLFQPWPTLLKNWTHLAVTHPGYVAFLTYDEVRARLQTYCNKPGSYVFRLSCTRLGQWAIGYVSRDGSILQTIPQDRPLFQALIEGHKEGFYLYPDGKNVNPDLTELTEPTAQNRIEVSPDQAQLYSQMGSTFQLCKICAENDKDVRLQPCGHLLCRDCLNAWQQVQTPTCPFCRREIQGHEEIRIDPVGGQGAGAAPDEDDDDLEDVESVLRELAALRKAGHPAFPPCLDPEVPGPPVPPRLDLLQPRDPDPTAQDLPLPPLGHPSQNPSDWIRHRPLPPRPRPRGPPAPPLSHGPEEPS
ncbi:E3 ubiquitin-protein ligase CBL-C isoform X3 [Mauremys mutica]|uniref:E3 ubiquitin-protein ligase CBL-C isoform X3 n=1 Tax=Mauremys mutica TaxID=74926 RepID=UPI001D149702|nr:E3 ubiquitin-protein ligase CBL-C isoform X3 [Mauremys mutica]